MQVFGRQLLKFCRDVNLNVWSGSGFSPVRMERDLKRVIPESIPQIFNLKQGGQGTKDFRRKGCVLTSLFKTPYTKPGVFFHYKTLDNQSD